MMESHWWDLKYPSIIILETNFPFKFSGACSVKLNANISFIYIYSCCTLTNSFLDHWSCFGLFLQILSYSILSGVTMATPAHLSISLFWITTPSFHFQSVYVFVIKVGFIHIYSLMYLGIDNVWFFSISLLYIYF